MKDTNTICKCGGTEFYLNDEGKRKGNLCKECVKQKAKDYYHSGTGKTNLQNWRANNPELYKAQSKKSREQVRDKTIKDPEFAARLRTEKRNNGIKNYKTIMLNRAKNRALKNGLEYQLTKDDILIPELCPILQVPFQFGTKESYLFSPSLDRLNSTKGYVKDNIAVISSLANTMKNVATKEQLLTFCKNLPQYIENMI